MNIRQYVVILLLALVCARTYAGFLAGNDLVENMREFDKIHVTDDYDIFKASAYHGYVAGVFDTLFSQGKICASADVTHAQINAIVAKYLKENPAKWAQPADQLIYLAFLPAFPCD